MTIGTTFLKAIIKIDIKNLDIFSYLDSLMIPVPKNYSEGNKECCVQNLGSKDLCQST